MHVHTNVGLRIYEQRSKEEKMPVEKEDGDCLVRIGNALLLVQVGRVRRATGVDLHAVKAGRLSMRRQRRLAVRRTENCLLLMVKGMCGKMMMMMMIWPSLVVMHAGMTGPHRFCPTGLPPHQTVAMDLAVYDSQPGSCESTIKQDAERLRDGDGQIEEVANRRKNVGHRRR